MKERTEMKERAEMKGRAEMKRDERKRRKKISLVQDRGGGHDVTL